MWMRLICIIVSTRQTVGNARLSLPDPSLDLREEILKYLSSLPYEGKNGFFCVYKNKLVVQLFGSLQVIQVHDYMFKFTSFIFDVFAMVYDTDVLNLFRRGVAYKTAKNREGAAESSDNDRTQCISAPQST